MDKKKRKETFSAYSWSAASLILILLIVIFPILYTAYISLTNMNVYHWNNYELIGLKNYKDALLVFDNGFITAFFVTILWTIVNMVLQLVIAFLMASLLNIKRLKLRNLYKTLLIFPWAMPGYSDNVIMAAGTFVSGATTELSADGPIRPPYTIFFQGGLTYESGRYGIMKAAERVLEFKNQESPK